MQFTTLIDAAGLARSRAPAAAAGPDTAPSRRFAPGPGATLVILDCRFDLKDPEAGRRAYEHAHVAGARYADLNRDLSGPVTASSGRHPLPEPSALAARLAAWGVGKHTQVVAYDEGSGSMAARAWWLLHWLGHEAAAVLDGGFAAWLAAGGPTETGQPAAPASAPTPRAVQPRADFQVSAEEVVAALHDPSRRIVDARAPERFAGSVEPIDAVAGHIPGAVNHPFTGNLDAAGRFLPPTLLRERWLSRLGGLDATAAILMCGSGVTACHNRLAMEIAGLPGAALYAGSWSEWIRDPRRPVASGVEAVVTGSNEI
jgi:thiosulfate/3-mercaptopyruvate sulfurtransferase